MNQTLDGYWVYISPTWLESSVFIQIESVNWIK